METDSRRIVIGMFGECPELQAVACPMGDGHIAFGDVVDYGSKPLDIADIPEWR